TASFERAAAIKPDFLQAKLAACVARLPILYENEPEIAARRADYAACLHALRDEVERSAPPGDLADAIVAHQPFYLAYQGLNDRDLQATYGAMVCRVMAARFGPAKLPAPPEPGEPARVAIVSGPLSLDAWRQAILAAAPHVIVYPEVGMDRVAAQLAAQRLAPVQCNAWGHPDTSGLPTLDQSPPSDLMRPPRGR